MVQVVQEFSVPDRTKPFKIEGTISEEIAIPQETARRKANAFLAGNVAMMIAAGEPRLVLGETIRWQIPAVLRLPQKGEIGNVGIIYVDAQTGDVAGLSDTDIHRMQELAHAIAAHYASSTAEAS
jgi:hypothetical protein